MTARIVALAFLAGTAVVSGAQRGEQPPVRFKVDVNFVEVDAIVTDRDGRFVADLGKQDFTVLEDGKPQVISAFTMVEMPSEEPMDCRPRRAVVRASFGDTTRPFRWTACPRGATFFGWRPGDCLAIRP